MAHLTNIPYLDNSNIPMYLKTLSDELIALGVTNLDKVDILVAGGSALALKHNLRSTVDIDADIRCRAKISGVIKGIAKRFNIPDDWINEEFMKSESYSRRLWTNAILLYNSNDLVRIFVTCDLDQLCMKALAGRRKDLVDIESICKILFTSTDITYRDYLQRLDYLYSDYIRESINGKKAVIRCFKKANRYNI